jgi:uncharacterized membrane protein
MRNNYKTTYIIKYAISTMINKFLSARKLDMIYRTLVVITKNV